MGYSEIDKAAISIYQYHFPNHKNYGDITQIDAKELPAMDLLVGGFPCQSFSIAGKRGGFEDTRGTLFFEIARIAKQKQPRYLLLENVKGLLSHDNGRTFRTIIATLDDVGYDCQWQVLNSKNHGVPQNRERVYIVGHLRGTPRPQVFPFGQNDQVSDGANESKQGRTQAEVSHTLRGANVKADQAFIIHNVYGGFGEEGVREFHDHSPTIRTPQGGGHIPMVYQRARGKNKGGEKPIAPTLTGKSYQDNNHLNGIRRLTPTECERLQGFPDGWTKKGVQIGNGPSSAISEVVISDTQRYKTLGNAVTTNTVRDIAIRLLTPPLNG